MNRHKKICLQFFIICAFASAACVGSLFPASQRDFSPTTEALIETVVSEIKTATALVEAEPAAPTVDQGDIPADASTPAPAVNTPATDAPAPLSRPVYNLVARLMASEKVLQARETIVYPNFTGQDLPELVLSIPPARMPGVFSLEAVILDGIALEGPQVSTAGWLRLPLSQPMAPGGQATIEVEYRLALPNLAENPDGLQASLRWTEGEMIFSDWIPFVPAYQAGQGWPAVDSFAAGEEGISEPADYRVEIQVDDPHLMLTAPGLGGRRGEGWYFEHPAARSFTWIAGRPLESASQSVEGVTIEAYFRDEHRAAGEAVLAAGSRALQLFNRLYGAYPDSRLVLYEGGLKGVLGMAGLAVIGQEVYAPYTGLTDSELVPITVQAVARQWWPGGVGSGPAAERWPGEALATYSEALYYETYHPEALDWWWELRVRASTPKGKLGEPVEAYESRRAYLDAVQLRGAQFLAALRQEMGDESFFSFLHSYAATYAAQPAGGVDFFGLAAASGVDSPVLIERYFQAEGPDLPPLPEQVLLKPMSHDYQRWNNCGPVSTAMALSAFGERLTQYEIAPQLKGSKDDSNVSPHEIAAYIRGLGYGAQVRSNGSPEKVMRFVALGMPVIVEQWLVRPNEPLTGHYRVVRGYDRAGGTFIVNDSYNGPNLRFGWAGFDALWRPFDRVYVVVYRPEDEHLVRSVLSSDWDQAAMHRRAALIAQREIETGPGDVYAWYNLGAARLGLGQVEEAAHAFDQAWQHGLPPRMPRYRFEIWEAFNAAGWFEQTLAYTEGLVEQPGIEEIHYYRGMAYLGLERKEEAAAAFRAALDDQPRFIEAAEALAGLEDSSGQPATP